MKKKTTIWISIILVFIVLFFLKLAFSTSADDKNQKSKGKAEKKIDALILKPTLLVNEITVSGSLLAFEEVELKNEVAGRVVFVNLPEGKPVKKGTVLVKLFNDDLQATLNKLKTQYNIQQQIYKRQSVLLKANGISQNDYEQTGLQLDALKADIEIQKTLIRKTEVLAPFDGIIGLRNISVGAIVTPSTLLSTIRMTDKMKLDFSVPERYSSVVKSGMDVQFSLSNDDEQFNASVLATEHGIDASTRNLKVRAVVKSKSVKLLPGSFANVVLQLSQNHNALMIPTQSIIPEEENKTVIIAKSGKAHFVAIETGTRNDANIEVTKGLEPGDTLVVSGILFLKEGTKLSYSTLTKQP